VSLSVRTLWNDGQDGAGSPISCALAGRQAQPIPKTDPTCRRQRQVVDRSNPAIPTPTAVAAARVPRQEQVQDRRRGQCIFVPMARCPAGSRHRKRTPGMWAFRPKRRSAPGTPLAVPVQAVEATWARVPTTMSANADPVGMEEPTVRAATTENQWWIAG
jgi:hypothetical protein